MRAFAVGAGQTPDFGRSPRAVPLGSLDIFAGPVTPRDLVTWASLSRGPPRATTRERRTRRMALRAAQNVAENGSALSRGPQRAHFRATASVKLL